MDLVQPPATGGRSRWFIDGRELALHGGRDHRLFGNATLLSPVREWVAVLPLARIVWGNLAAMRQPSLRRMIAYSSIARAGYLFLAFLGEPAGRLLAVAF